MDQSKDTKPYKKDFAAWAAYAAELDSTVFDDFCYEREIWWCAIGTNIGSEYDGKNGAFERPVLIVKKINQDLIWVLPLTTSIKHHEYRLPIGSTGTASQIIISQLRTVSTKRLLRKIGRARTIVFQRMLAMLAVMLLEILKNETPSDDGESRSPKATVSLL